MKHIILDFEMNPIDSDKYPEQRKVSSREIIEIGAIMLDDDYKEISHFKSYVCPEYNNEIRAEITRLTGITWHMVAGFPHFNDVLNQFVSWCSFDGEFTVYAWSDCDRTQMIHELALKHTEFTPALCEMLNGWTDFQKEYGKLVGKNHSLSLDKALDALGIGFLGKRHDALDDARNTSEIFILSRDVEKFNEALKHMEELLEDSNPSTTLGDLIDFSKYGFKEDAIKDAGNSTSPKTGSKKDSDDDGDFDGDLLGEDEYDVEDFADEESV